MQIDEASSYYFFSNVREKYIRALQKSLLDLRMDPYLGFITYLLSARDFSYCVQATTVLYYMVKALNLSEAARIALLQEMMRDAKRTERGGLLACLVGVVVAVAGFSSTPYAGNSINLGVVGLAIAAVGFVVYLHYARLYSRFVGQLAKIAFKSAAPCPRCGKGLPEGEFDFCPYCGLSLKSEGTLQQEFLEKNATMLS